MKKTLSPSETMELELLIEESSKFADELTNLSNEARKTSENLLREAKECEQQAQRNRIDSSNALAAASEHDADLRVAHARIAEARVKLTENAHTEKVNAEFQNQATFFQMVEKRIQRLQEALEDAGGLYSFTEPATATERIKTFMEGQSFSRDVVAMRTMKKTYENTVWDMCERRVKGELVDVNLSLRLLDDIDHWLKGEMSSFWKS
jgi:DNA repair exonuclease SbcCD ATPase subunit